MPIKPFRWQPLLLDGELLLWQGRPYPALTMIRPTQPEWLVGALGAVAVAGLLVLDHAVPVSAATGWAMVAMLVIALMVMGIPFRQMRQRSNALKRRNYAVTDRRVLVVEDQRRPDLVQAWPMPKTARPVLEDEGQRLSTLHFGAESPRLTHLRDAEKIAIAITAGREAEAKMRTR